MYKKTVGLKFAYLTIGILAVSYFAAQAQDVAVFWMNDEQTRVSRVSMYFYFGFHFLLPIILLFNTVDETRIKLLFTHFLAATFSAIALIIAIKLSNDHADVNVAQNSYIPYIAGLAYNILKFVSYIFLYFIIAAVVFEKVKGTKNS